MSKVIIGIDMGTTAIRAVTELKGKEVSAIVDSIYAPVLGAGLFGGIRGKATNGKAMTIQHAGVSHHVGAGSQLYGGMVHPIDQSRFTDGALLKPLLAAIGKLGLKNDSDLVMSLSLPVEVENRQGITEIIESWILGKHSFLIDNVRHSYTISEVFINCQPIHAYIGINYSTQFVWSHPIYKEGAPFVILDLGGGTLDIAAIEVMDGEPVVDYDKVRGGEFGFLRAAEEVNKKIVEDGNESYKLYQIDALIRDLCQGNESISIYQNGLAKSIADDARAAIDSMLINAVEFCRPHISGKAAEKYSIAIIGGAMGSSVVRDKFKAAYPKAIINPDRYLAARGAYILAKAALLEA